MKEVYKLKVSVKWCFNGGKQPIRQHHRYYHNYRLHCICYHRRRRHNDDDDDDDIANHDNQ